MHYDDSRDNDFATGDAIGPRDPDDLKVALERVNFPGEKLDILLATELEYFERTDEWIHTVSATLVPEGTTGQHSTWTEIHWAINERPENVLEPLREVMGVSGPTSTAVVNLSFHAIELHRNAKLNFALQRTRKGLAA